ncbi:MAG: Gfo/Idh/MocA family oxidoreductase [bacterium]
MNRPVKVGLVGVGYLGSRHLHHLISLNQVEVAGVWDTDPQARSNAQERGIKVFSDLDSLLQNVEAVIVATPTSTHYDIGQKVLESNRHLFIEKPLASSAIQGQELVEEANKRGLVLQVGHIERFNSAFRSLFNFQIKPHFIEGHRLALWNPRGSDVAVVLDLMIHDIDLVLTLMGGNPVRILASGVGVVTSSIDIANARLEFSQGRVANLTASRISLKRMRKLRLFGEREYISLDMEKGTCEVVKVSTKNGAKGLSWITEGLPPSPSEVLYQYSFQDTTYLISRQTIENDGKDAMELELTSFIDTIKGHKGIGATGQEALKALIVAEEVVQAIQTNLSLKG